MESETTPTAEELRILGTEEIALILGLRTWRGRGVCWCWPAGG